MPNDVAVIDRQFPELTDLQERFVVAFVSNGGKGQAAARSAGYSRESARVMPAALLGSTKVCDAITSAMVKQLAASAPAALAVIAKLAVSARSEYVRLEAAKDVLDRVGLSAPKRINLGGQLSVSFDLS